MENPFFNRLGNALWVGLVILVVTLAIYVSAGRLLTANLGHFRVDILQALNARLPFAIAAGQVSGDWQSFTPVIVLTDLRVTLPGSGSPPLVLARGRIGVDVLNSLRTRSLQVTRLVLNGLTLHGELSRDGRFTLAGFSGGEAGRATGPLREFLLNIERISLRDNRLVLTLPDGAVRNLGLDLTLSREGSQRDVQATLSSSTGARIAVLAQGLGDPFKPDTFAGQLYLDMQSTDLGAIKGLFAGRSPPVWVDGAADMEVWLNWDRGRPSVVARVEGSDLQIAARAVSPLPLRRVALDARLLRRGKDWTLFVANLLVEEGGVEWTLPRLQLDTRDNALRVRTARFALAPVNTIVTGWDAVPETLREVFTALRPRGDISALQVKFGDAYQPADDWLVEANFAGVAVDSLHGAPGVTAATGYTRLAPTGGRVILDGRAMSLDFPSVYRDPLHFDELHGTLHLDWDTQRVRLASGLLTTQGPEGAAKVLFGLNIPLRADDIGIEMDLLVGLRDTRPVHRVKFIPYILDPALLAWLADSIGEGVIEQGAFLWRGSLRQDAAPLRTVQLAFNVVDTQLSYHPRWPPVLVQQGIVLIDDSNASVWAEHASLFASSVDRLSVETRLNAAGDITLDVQGSVHGPAADGFTVLNESPLAEIAGPAFADWTASGSLDTDLRLHMNLSDASVAPRMDVVTRWRDVDLLLMPGDLPLQAVNGEFAYSTATGFSAGELVGTLWGNAVSASLRQHHDVEHGAYSPASTVLDVNLATVVDMADVRRWLHLDSLGFASGETAADVGIRLAPGIPPVLTVNSELRGVSLDLPQPWRKPAEEAQHLRLEIPLARGVVPLSVDLGEQLHLRLELDRGVVRSGALGINEPPPPAEEGVLRITGHAPLLQADEWFGLVAQYAGALGLDGSMPGSVETPARQPVQPPSAEVSSAVSTPQPQPGAQSQAGAPLRIVVDELRADTVQILARELRDVVFSLALDRARWELTLATDWLRGELSREREGDPVRLAIGYLDLDRLPDSKSSHNGGDSSWEMPPLDVTLSNLFQSGQRLGGLRFALREQSGVLTADTITGELAGLRLRTGQPGRLVWHRGPNAYTEVQANLHFADLGQTLAYFDYQRTVETEEGDFAVKLRWPGAPRDFSLSQAQGSLRVRTGSGNFLEASAGATEALRVVSILNLADIVQRLSLSHMFESGIPFDSVQGEVALGDGMLTVAHMDVQGGSSFQFSGVSDVRTKSLQGELVATLPVVNNLPWIAALAASLPVAAGVYVVSQVFNKQMNRLSSAVYTIDGTWNDPRVSLDRIFDNTPDAPAGTANGTTPDTPAPAQPVSP